MSYTSVSLGLAKSILPIVAFEKAMRGWIAWCCFRLSHRGVHSLSCPVCPSLLTLHLRQRLTTSKHTTLETSSPRIALLVSYHRVSTSRYPGAASISCFRCDVCMVPSGASRDVACTCRTYVVMCAEVSIIIIWVHSLANIVL